MKSFKIILILIFILVLDIIFTKSYQFYKSIEFSKGNYMALNNTYHHELKKNYIGKGRQEEIIFTNKYGFIQLEKQSKINLKDKKNIILIGDSFTQGAGVDYRNTFAGILTNRLKDKKNLINMSAISYSPSIYFYKTKFFIENYNMKFSDMYVFIDISDPYDELYRYEVKNERVINRTNLNNPFINNFYDKIIHYIKKIVSNNTTILYFTLRSFKNVSNKKNIDEQLFYEKYGFIINHQANIWTFNEKYFEKEGYKGIELSKKYLKLLKELLDKNNANLTIVVYPWPGQIFRNDKNKKQSSIWQKWAIKNDVKFIDISKLFFREKNNSELDRLKIIDKYYLEKDMHFNQNAHKIVAIELLKHIN